MYERNRRLNEIESKLSPFYSIFFIAQDICFEMKFKLWFDFCKCFICSSLVAICLICSRHSFVVSVFRAEAFTSVCILRVFYATKNKFFHQRLTIWNGCLFLFHFVSSVIFGTILQQNYFVNRKRMHQKILKTFSNQKSPQIPTKHKIMKFQSFLGFFLCKHSLADFCLINVKWIGFPFICSAQ